MRTIQHVHKPENKCRPLIEPVWSVDIICGKGVSKCVANTFESILISMFKSDTGRYDPHFEAPYLVLTKELRSEAISLVTVHQ